MNNNYAVIWSDGFPTTLYKTIEDAREAVQEVEATSSVTGQIVTIDEYMKA